MPDVRSAPEHVPDRHLDAGLQVFELEEQIDEVLRSASTLEHGHSAETLAKYPSLRLVLIGMRAGASLGEHKAHGRVSLQTVRGEVVLVIGPRRILLPAGTVASLDRDILHDVVAQADSAVLLTVCWEGHPA
ncbi:MAG: hypothetical protein IRZ16_17050 [Myxococcaceae bacterium]|nr:hypothetical protein [Myxococcaceae bacterium]